MTDTSGTPPLQCCSEAELVQFCCTDRNANLRYRPQSTYTDGSACRVDRDLTTSLMLWVLEALFRYYVVSGAKCQVHRISDRICAVGFWFAYEMDFLTDQILAVEIVG